MKQKLLKTLAGAVITIAFAIVFCLPANAQSKVEKLVIYENFGGVDAGTSVPDIQPTVWPAVHSDSAKQSGWYSTTQKIDGVNQTALVPQFYTNGIFHIDSVKKYRTSGLTGLNITVDDATKTWSYPVTLRNGYKMPFSNATTVGFRLLGVAALPEFYSWLSYGLKVPDYLKNQTDEKGYLYFSKDPTVNGKVVRPILTIPGSDVDLLQNVSKIEMLISGSRLGSLNTMSVTMEEVTQDGVTVGTKTLTYSATIEPRLITVPVNMDYCRIYIQAWGDAKNANVTDYALLTSNTEVDTKATYNYNAIVCTKPDGTASAGVLGNPGMSLHMIKIYAKVDGGYTIKTDATVTGTKTGISYGDSTTLTAPATNGSSKKFMGWRIYGRPDLSEVANPLKIAVTDTMTILPIYAGDMVEVPVVNENFTDWKQVGTTDATKNNGLIYTLDGPTGTYTGAIRVPLRYGFLSGGKDSVDITLNTCYVIPQYGLRVYNVPGWQNYPGYVAFMGPKGTKGYVSVGALDGITKAEVDLSNLDVAGAPDRACAIKVNGTIARNKMLQTLYAQTVVIKNNPATSFALQVGPGNQARSEYLNPETPAADIFTSSISAAPIAMHNLKLYATIAVPEKNYFKLTATAETGGNIAGTSPSCGNSTNQFMEGTKVTICAAPLAGYGFDGWVDGNGTSLGTAPTITLTMDANKTIKALFAQNPSYIKLVANSKGSVTYSIDPKNISHDTLTFLAGLPISLTAVPVYGFKFNKWNFDGKDSVNIKSGVNILNPFVVSASSMTKSGYHTLAVAYDSITARQNIKAISDTTMGKITFSHNPENIAYSGDTLKAQFPQGVAIDFTAAPAYGYDFSKWTKGFNVASSDSAKNPVTITMSADKTIAANWVVLARKRLELGTGPNGTIRITDKHKDGTQEQQSLWPINYQVELTARPASGYVLASVGSGVSVIFVNDSVVTVAMDKDTVRVVPEFVAVKSGVVLAVNENFQSSKLWPEPVGTVSNVPGAIDFLQLDANWDPKTYNNNLEGLLKILAPYRVWGSAGPDNSEGPGGTKTPKTTMVLKYQNAPLISKLRIGTSRDSAKVTVANYAPCNNCLISKAVKEANISNKYLGHVTPGFVALKKLSLTTRSAETNPAILQNDTIGMMLIEGLAYVQKLEVGYVSGGTQFAPGVFYITTQGIFPIKSTGVFDASYSDLWPIGQVTRPDYSPYNNKYGWGASQEGMLMDQGMYVAEDGLAETKILITAGYKKTGNTGSQVYSYSDIYIHDLRIWGSPKINTGINDLINSKDKTVDGCKFYMLGSTNMLKVDVDDQIKAVVIYNVNGAAVKVARSVDGNQVDLSSLKPGFYGAHAYGYSGKMYKGGFVKIN